MMPVTRETVTDEHLNELVKKGRYNYRPKRAMPLGLRTMCLLTIACWALVVAVVL